MSNERTPIMAEPQEGVVAGSRLSATGIRRGPTAANTLLLAFELLFGCWHRNLSRPFTLSGWTYEVCLNCGKKLAYDRADIGCLVAQRKDPGRDESLRESDRAVGGCFEGC